MQPVEISVAKSRGPISSIFDAPPQEGVRLRNRTVLKGEIRYTTAPFQGNVHWLNWGLPQNPIEAGRKYDEPISMPEGFMIRVTESGAHTVSMKTQSGRAKLWLDFDADGLFSDSEEVITELMTVLPAAANPKAETSR